VLQMGLDVAFLSRYKLRRGYRLNFLWLRRSFFTRLAINIWAEGPLNPSKLMKSMAINVIEHCIQLEAT
jgi:hypothetical protein